MTKTSSPKAKEPSVLIRVRQSDHDKLLKRASAARPKRTIPDEVNRLLHGSNERFLLSESALAAGPAIAGGTPLGALEAVAKLDNTTPEEWLRRAAHSAITARLLQHERIERGDTNVRGATEDRAHEALLADYKATGVIPAPTRLRKLCGCRMDVCRRVIEEFKTTLPTSS